MFVGLPKQKTNIFIKTLSIGMAEDMELF